MLSGVVVGDLLPEQWGAPPRSVDFYDVKADIEALLGVGEAVFQAAEHPALHPGQAAAIRFAGDDIGVLGAIHPSLAQKLEMPSKTYLFELDLDSLLKSSVPRFQKLSRFPSIRRDLAYVVNVKTPVGSLREAIAAQAGALLQDLMVFDVYQGKGIESGRKSVAFGLILQDSSRTLTDGDVDAVVNRITAQLEKQFGATLRE
jgi:phenylalanyl-tRNA synthetase beta chain